MKRAIIVHCWGGEPDYAWYPWVAKQLEAKGYNVSVPEMPDTEEPQLTKWLGHLQEVIGEPDEDLVLIGHSLGCATIMRYLETLNEEQRVGKVIFVAGFTDQLGFKELENFFREPLDFEKIRPRSADGFVAIQSDDDPFVADQYGVRLEEELGAELLIKTGVGHMSGSVTEDDSCTELPEVVKEATGVPVKISRIRMPKGLKKTLAGVLILLILITAAGVGYTYYVGKQNSSSVSNSVAALSTADSQAATTIKPSTPPPNTPESVAIELLSSPIAPGSAAYFSVKTLPNSSCSVAITYSKETTPALSLASATANNFGIASWNWTVSPSAPVGQGTVKATCISGKKSAFVLGTLQVT